MNPAFAEWGEGWDPVDPPVPTQVEAGKVEVLEFFWYACGHCYHLEPELDEWLKTQKGNIEFRRVPAPLNPRWAVHSQFYYAAETLGVVDKLHKPLFDAIHEKNRRLFSKESLIDFAVEHGIDRKAFTEAWNSFGVFLKVQQAKKLGDKFQITGVPALGINGKYVTSASLAGSHANMFKIIDELVAKESAELAKAP
jgi:thiol:disulfide interchange protein DsbA